MTPSESLIEPGTEPRRGRWTPDPEPFDWQRWVKQFEASRGRKARILHIGNVANNGYNNAKVLVEAGFDCDALCYDYYHIMGCPEWEDADFSGMVEDHFTPNWREVDLRGFRRQRWFAQGPRYWAIAYLLARRNGRARSASILWRVLSFQQWLISKRRTRWLQGCRSFARFCARQYERARAAKPKTRELLEKGVASTLDRITRLAARVARFYRRPRAMVLWHVRRVRHVAQAGWSWGLQVGLGWPWPFSTIWRVLLHLLMTPVLVLALLALLACIPVVLLDAIARKIGRRVRRSLARPISSAVPRPLPRPLSLSFRMSRAWSGVKHGIFAMFTGVDPRDLDTPAFEAEFQSRCAELIADFDRRFPDRPDRLVMLDMLPYRSVLPLWKELFSRYDLVEAYATDPILAMLTGYKPCVAYEHGTIRDIPFADNPTARLTALAYARCDAVVITNPDCREAADRLGVKKFVPIPHLIDRKYYDPGIADDGPLPPEVCPPYIFSPARHDWDIKGTDILIRSFAAIAREYPDLQLVTPSWGMDVHRSRELIAQLGLNERVAMIEPLNIHNLIRVTRGARALVDQFRFGVFGGIGPTALAVGTPLITHLDHDKSDWCMEPPPYFQAHDVATCTQALRAALQCDPGALRASLRAWMRRNYWHGQVVARHATLFARLIDQKPRSTP